MKPNISFSRPPSFATELFYQPLPATYFPTLLSPPPIAKTCKLEKALMARPYDNFGIIKPFPVANNYGPCPYVIYLKEREETSSNYLYLLPNTSPKSSESGFVTNSSPLSQYNSSSKNLTDCSSSLSLLDFSKKKKAKKTSITETFNVKEAVNEMEKNIGKKFTLNYFCEKYNIKRRVLFDFLSIMNGLTICTRYSNDDFQWNGIKLDHKFVSTINKTFLNSSRPLKLLFNCSEKIGLNVICFHLISLFLYLDLHILDLRKVAKIFASPGTPQKTMLRKLYTISSSLETIGFISRTGKPAEIRLSDIFFDSIPKNIALSSILISDPKEEQLFLKRRNEFEASDHSD